MKIIYCLLICSLFSCESEYKESIEINENIVIQSSNTDTPVELDNDKLSTEGSLNILCQKWNLQHMYIIDQKGTKNEFNQGKLTLEFLEDFTCITKMESMGIIANGIWEIDSLSTILKMEGVSINGKELEEHTIQQNKIISLDEDEFIYSYDDPITRTEILMEFKSN